jgi:hypothetical protein
VREREKKKERERENLLRYTVDLSQDLPQVCVCVLVYQPLKECGCLLVYEPLEPRLPHYLRCVCQSVNEPAATRSNAATLHCVSSPKPCAFACSEERVGACAGPNVAALTFLPTTSLFLKRTCAYDRIKAVKTDMAHSYPHITHLGGVD